MAVARLKPYFSQTNFFYTGAHAIDNVHEINWKDVKILDKEPNYNKRILSEMLHINIHTNTINKIEDTIFKSHVQKGSQKNPLTFVNSAVLYINTCFCTCHCILTSLKPLCIIVPAETTQFGKHRIYLLFFTLLVLVYKIKIL